MFNIDYIRRLIWIYSSRMNNRIIENDRIDEEYKDWKIIKSLQESSKEYELLLI